MRKSIKVTKYEKFRVEMRKFFSCADLGRQHARIELKVSFFTFAILSNFLRAT